MSPDLLFSFANTFVLAGWAALAILPWWKRADRFVTGIVVTLLAVLYVYLIVTNFHPADFKSFSSLAGIAVLFQNKTVLLAGWVHYLAFDLMTGLFIVRNAQRHRIPHGLAMLCALGCFMLGPAGLLLYFIIRAIKARSLAPSNDTGL